MLASCSIRVLRVDRLGRLDLCGSSGQHGAGGTPYETSGERSMPAHMPSVMFMGADHYEVRADASSETHELLHGIPTQEMGNTRVSTLVVIAAHTSSSCFRARSRHALRVGLSRKSPSPMGSSMTVVGVTCTT